MHVREARKMIGERLELGQVSPGVFHGEWTAAGGRPALASISPIDGSVLGSVTQGNGEDFENVVSAAQRSFLEWSAIPAPVRGETIGEIGAELLKEKELLGLLVTLEAGKTLTEGAGEIQEAVDIASFAAGLSRQLYGLTIASERPDHRLMEQWHPLGVVGVITSFNFPAAVWAWNSLIAAAVGNVTIWKPSSSTLLTAVSTLKVVNRVLERKGLPSIFFLACGSGSTIGGRMTDDPRIPLVSFTGSTSVGRSVGERLAARFGKTILELGGSNCAVVTENADLPLAVKGVAFGALATAGQRCTSTRRALVHGKIYDGFIEELKRVYSSVRIGNPLENDTIVGPLVDGQAVSAFSAAVKKAVNQGGRVIHGGTVQNVEGCEDGFYVTPTIIEMDCQEGIVLEETFAPVIYVMKYRELNQAIHLHNAVPQGLSSAIFSTDIRETERFISSTGSDCGIVNVNTSTAGAEIGGAFGGEKETGGGRESGSDAWKYYARRQTVTVNYGSDIPLSQGVEFPV